MFCGSCGYQMSHGSCPACGGTLPKRRYSIPGPSTPPAVLGVTPLPLRTEQRQYLAQRCGREAEDLRALEVFRLPEYSDYILFPLRELGEFKGWHGRYCRPELTRGRKPKWISSPGAGQFVWGLDKLLPRGMIYVCEGIFDALYFGDQGVALMGWRPAQSQIRKILSKEPSRIVLAIDADLSNRALLNATRAFQRQNRHIEVSIYSPMSGDWGDLLALGKRHKEENHDRTA